jgi:hypothetical protein
MNMIASDQERQSRATWTNGERAKELTTDSQPTGSFRSTRSMRGSGKRSALCARFTTSKEVIAEGAADQVVDADSPLAMAITRPRTTIKPLLRYGNLRFNALSMLLRINTTKSPTLIHPHINARAKA